MQTQYNKENQTPANAAAFLVAVDAGNVKNIHMTVAVCMRRRDVWDVRREEGLARVGESVYVSRCGGRSGSVG